MADEEYGTIQEQRKQLRRNRIKRYFVSAAKEIIGTDGFSAITTRRVSEMAGYNSGTLYNYFDDLDHVVFLACMETLEKYNEIVAERVQGITCPIEKYLTTAECFSECCHQAPQIFWQLFYGCPVDKRENYVQEYYELFPHMQSEKYQTLEKAKLTHNVSQRNMLFLTESVEAGYLSMENAKLYDGLSSMITKCLLEDVIRGRLTAEQAQDKARLYYRHTLKSYLKPQFQHLIKE